MNEEATADESGLGSTTARGPMNQLRLDPLSGRWVVVSPGRSERPYSFVTRSPWVQEESARPCPFCAGNEETTPPALETYGPTGHWLVRVVPNLYPAFEGDEPFVVANRGPVFTQASAGGIHEMLVIPREHFPHLHKSPTQDLLAVGEAIRRCLGRLAESVGDVAYNIVFH